MYRAVWRMTFSQLHILEKTVCFLFLCWIFGENYGFCLNFQENYMFYFSKTSWPWDFWKNRNSVMQYHVISMWFLTNHNLHIFATQMCNFSVNFNFILVCEVEQSSCLSLWSNLISVTKAFVQIFKMLENTLPSIWCLI